MTTATSADPQPSTSGGAGILEVMRSEMPGLSPAEQRVARYVLADPLSVMHLSVSELAEASGSSVGTIVRCCQTLGLRGFQALKLALARESNIAQQHLLDEITPDDGPAEITAKVLSETTAALNGARTLDTEALGQIADTLVHAGRILFVAIGTSAPLASDISYRLSSIGFPAFFLPDVHAQHVAARMLTPEDVCVAISHTGSTIETLATVRSAVTAGATTVALTSFARSPLTELVDQLLVAGSRETNYRIEAMTSRIVHLTVLDALFVVMALRHEGTARAQAATAEVLIEHRL